MVFGTIILGNSLSAYLIFFLILIGSILAGKLFYWISKNILRRISSKTENKLDDILLDILERPVVFLILILGFTLGLSMLVLSERAHEITNNILIILFIIDGAWFFMQFIDILLINYIRPFAQKTKSELDDQLLPILRKLSKVIIVAITLVMIIDNFGYDVTSLVAGLGLGGLAFALAAQDLLGNMFGGIAILTDKPFKVGERIKVNQHDGHVKEIGIRSTRIVTMDGTQLTLPNSMIANSVLENVSKEKTRRIITTIGVTHNTSHTKITEAKKILTKIVLDNKETEDNSEVSLYDFGENALQIRLIYWIKNLNDIVRVKDEINMEIKRQFDKAKIEMAFPTRTVYMKKG